MEENLHAVTDKPQTCLHLDRIRHFFDQCVRESLNQTRLFFRKGMQLSSLKIRECCFTGEYHHKLILSSVAMICWTMQDKLLSGHSQRASVKAIDLKPADGSASVDGGLSPNLLWNFLNQSLYFLFAQKDGHPHHVMSKPAAMLQLPRTVSCVLKCLNCSDKCHAL